jgi:hypothetical protein
MGACACAGPLPATRPATTVARSVALRRFTGDRFDGNEPIVSPDSAGEHPLLPKRYAGGFVAGSRSSAAELMQ